MQKSKGKVAQENFLQYFLNEYILFRRDFFYEIAVAPEILVEKLRHIRYYKKTSSWLGQKQEEHIRIYITDLIQPWQFEIISEYTDKNETYIQNAQANGIISVDDGTTFIEGKIIMGSSRAWFIVFMLILFLSLVIWQFGSYKVLETGAAILLLTLGIPLVWFNMYSDRNHLAKIIEQAVESANEPIYD